MTGTIFNIQKFCTHDGPGIRTTVFLKGCPMSCKWCHNPESIEKEPVMAFYVSKCKRCGRCLSVCENNAIDPETFQFKRELCTKCGKCIAKCLVSAREKFGYDTTVEEVIASVMKDKVFYDNSKGGVTFSGGEPFFQFEFLMELLKSSKENGLNVAVETNGLTSFENIKEASKYIDLFLMDLKIMDNERHKKYCGTPNKQVLANARKISELGKDILFRVPLIPGINDSIEDLTQLADFVNSLPNKHKVELLKYHEIGTSKYDACGMDYELRSTRPVDDIKEAIDYLKSKGVEIEE